MRKAASSEAACAFGALGDPPQRASQRWFTNVRTQPAYRSGTEYRAGMSDLVTVRLLTPDDWAVAREVRLAALADAPEAFASSLERERARTEHDWREMLAPERGVRAVAEAGGAVAGVVGAFSRGDHGEVVWMWTRPERCGQGVGAALVTFAVDWCAGNGLPCRLWVVDENESARRFYERLGFAYTGRSQPVPNDQDRTELEMAYQPS